MKRFTVNRVHREVQSQHPTYLSKGSESAPLISWLASLVLVYTEVCPPSRKSEALVVASMLHGLASYFYVCKQAGRFFAEQEADQVHSSGHQYLFMYSELRRRSIHENTNLWHLIPKHHQFQHLLLDCQLDRVNPRWFHCFGDEDQIGRVLRVSRAAHAGTVVTSTMSLYRFGLVRRLAKFKAEAL